jgi:dipeptidyl-peptidase-4
MLAYVWRNNIYLWEDGKVTALTKDGGANIFNGVPDWVYEEEILESRTGMWWSPDGEALAWLRTDDTDVYTYTVNYYMDAETPGKMPYRPYPRELKIKYPKVGYPNPRAEVRMLRLKEEEFPRLWQTAGDGEIIGEVTWVADNSEQILVRTFNRLQNKDAFTIHHARGSYTEQINYIDRQREVKDGWLENTKSIHYIGNITGTESYIEVNDIDGWMHIWRWPTQTKYESTPFTGEPRAIPNNKQLTKGEWEVRKIHGVDRKRGLVYYTSTENHPTESHPYSLNLITGERKLLVDNKPGYWGMSVSPGAEYAVLHYEGPGVPHQALYTLNGTAQSVRVLETNERLAGVLKEYALPKTEIMDIKHPKGHTLSARLITPPSFDESGAKKYPILLTPYGGPGSQEVTKKFSNPSFKEYLSSDPDLEYVTFTVDNRGTGFRGSKFRNSFYKNMGTVDVEDQMWAARWLAEKYPWVDRDRIGIWGWSNGGYLSAKCVESGDDILAFAIATAPTSDQRLYDSMYSERYFGTLPDEDPEPWDRSMIKNATGFKNLRGSILFQHGTGDDNVHFQHSLTLVDMLMQGGVHPDRVQTQYFPDSEHSIRYGRDPEFLFKQITAKLFMEKNRVHDRRKTTKHQWEEEREVARPKYYFEENQRNVLLAEEMRPGTRSKWRMVQGDEVIGS